MAVRVLKDGPHILVSLSVFEEETEVYFSPKTDVDVAYVAPSARMVYKSRAISVFKCKSAGIKGECSQTVIS